MVKREVREDEGLEETEKGGREREKKTSENHYLSTGNDQR